MIQSGNWMGARDPARELEGHVMQVTHHKTYYTTLKTCGTGLVPTKSTGPAQIPPEPEFWPGPNTV